MKKIILVMVLLCGMNIFSMENVETKLKKIAFFSTRSSGDMFWGKFEDFMKEAGNDLGVEVKVYYANGSHLKMTKQAKEEIMNKNRADVLIVANFKRQAKIIVEMAEKSNMPIFIVNSGLQKEDQMGNPREKYRNWIGEMLPDDEGAGYKLAKKLIEVKQGNNKSKRIEMLGIGGNIADFASVERVKGLKRAINESKNVKLKQVVYANWEKAEAKEKYEYMKKVRYPNLDVVWTASDGMSLGVAESSINLPTGGVDWSDEGIEAVKSEKIVASIGGHYMEGAWALIVLYDYFNGKDFKEESLRMKTGMYVLDNNNIDEYMNKLNQKKWNEIDFTKFSKKLNKKLKKYDFSLEKVIKSIY